MTRLKENPFKDGQIGGHCHYNPSAMTNTKAHRMSLSTWIVQIEKYSSLSFHPINDGHCDVIVEKPTYFMKLDATVNLYHHFCDYFNLYLTFHVNGSFSKDINIVLWEESRRNSLGNFGATWPAFTDNEIIYLGEAYRDKRVCFKEAIFALLPRMVFGLFYNTPLVPGCFKTGLFKAFNRFLMERLDIKQEKNITDIDEPIRIGLLSRGTAYRQILNQQEIEEALQGLPGTKFEVLNYNWKMPFLDQLKTSHNLDIFIGMHGAGLTHMLFMPDWAAVFEVYNCGDENCYKDLARLRGLNYYTWENEEKLVERTENKHDKYGDNLKFRNFAFDVKEFMRIVSNMVEQVKKNIREYKA
ncbi:EGF domain-specific O-linked N-acetylglucosamine transferase-like [Paramuricea clavata]|uniref:EGF domain-specific O-linked N-acetylglucosamine transferase n=1 Tax=Paramuricea clavata TaxID=317549 RepID=A0A6S7GCS3_PARCT|nr:EGF domain-specific O-linked N-acetylglucosamine transferase-like [Paramuricea clavata]